MIKKLNDIKNRKLYARIRTRQNAGTMKEYVVDGYLCYDDCELKTYKPKKSGRNPKLRTEIQEKEG